MQRQSQNHLAAAILALGTLSSGFSQSAVAQSDSSPRFSPAREIIFEAEGASSRKNPLEQFQLHPTPAGPASQARLTALVQKTAEQSSPPTQPIVTGPRVEPSLNPVPTTNASSSDLAQNSSAQDSSQDRSNSETMNVPYGAGETVFPVRVRQLSAEVKAVNISISQDGEVPDRVKLGDSRVVGLPTGLERGVAPSMVNWQPTLMMHYPLFFEDAMLERHGQVRFGCVQPLASGVKFLATIPIAPYLQVLRPAHKCEYVLGHYRAGSCAPILRNTLPYDKHAAVVETLLTASYFWAMPL